MAAGAGFLAFAFMHYSPSVNISVFDDVTMMGSLLGFRRLVRARVRSTHSGLSVKDVLKLKEPSSARWEDNRVFQSSL